MLYQYWEDGTYNIDSLQNLDTTKISWDIFNPNPDSTTDYHKILRINIAAKEGKQARACFTDKNEPDERPDKTVFRLLFANVFIGMDTILNLELKRT